MEVVTFSFVDYLLFILMLVSGAIVGIYYGFFKKQNTAQDYLLGGKQMNVWLVSMSQISSALSGYTLLSMPADIYRYGITYGLVVVINLICALASYYLFLPIFYKLQITSVYEYFNKRFNNKVRVFASFLYGLYMTVYLPVVIYTPALALEQATNLNVHVITPIVCAVCIFYTTMGGLRAVVLTDVIQFGVMLGSLLVVVTAGIWLGGGLGTILSDSYNNGQLHMNFDLDFIKRDTFWAVMIGQSAQVVSYLGASQGSVQKYLSLSTFFKIKIALIWSTIGIATIQALSVFCGVLMFSKYLNCDPLEAKIIKRHDQIFSLYVMEQVNFIPGLCGLFISGIFSAGLSTLSAMMNCFAAIIYEDFVSPFISKNTSQERISQYLKLIVVIIGIESIAMVYLIQRMGGVIQITLSLSAITTGPTLGLFLVGMLLPQVTSKGALSGGIVSVCVMAWIILTSQYYKMQGLITYPTLPLSTKGCNETIVNTINETISTITGSSNISMTKTDDVFILYKVSFYWYAAIGLVISVIVSVVVSYFTDEDSSLNEDTISPTMQFLIKRKNQRLANYDETVLETLNKK